MTRKQTKFKRIRVLKTKLASSIKNIPTEIITIKYLF